MSVQDSRQQGGPGSASLAQASSSALEQVQEQKGPLVKLIGHRETHSSRTVAASLVALALILLVAWVATELLLSTVGLAPLLLSSETLFRAFFSAPQWLTPALAGLIGGVLALLGFILLFLACAPGTLRRHKSTTGRFAFVADDKVIASAMSAAIRRYAGLTEDQVVSRVSPRQVLVTITPVSGHRLNLPELTAYAQATLDAYALAPAPKVRVQLEKQGVVSNG